MARDRAMDGDVKAICDIVREGILPTRRRDDR
jgi:histidine ammonia-lyase